MESAPQYFGTLFRLWKTWSLHGFVLSSFCLQLLLFFVAPLRRRTTCILVVVAVWSAYQLVSPAMNRALSLMNDALKEEGKGSNLVHIYLLWAAFLVVHFGGPDSITALAIQDNALWRRSYSHLLGLIIATFNVFLAVRNKGQLFQSPVLVPTLLIYLVGILKSAEKILSLQRASDFRFRRSLVSANPNPGPDYSLIMEAFDSYTSDGLPAEFVTKNAPPDPDRLDTWKIIGSSSYTAGSGNWKLSRIQVVELAYHFFEKYKGIYVDMMFCCHDRKESRDIFLHLCSEDAFGIIETEMKFAYEFFYTKTNLILHHRFRYIRYLAFLLEIVSLYLWLRSVDSLDIGVVDIRVTNSLLVGNLFIDAAALIRLVASDWNIALPQSSKAASVLFRLPLQFSSRLLYMGRPRWADCPDHRTPRLMGILFRQWSGLISQFNFLNYCIDQRCECCNAFYRIIGAKDAMDGWKYVTNTWLTKNLRDFIFEELKQKSLVADSVELGKEIGSSRGSWTLSHSETVDFDPITLGPWIKDAEYDECVVNWHIATELCYVTEDEPESEEEKRHRGFSKILSDYMMYLLVRQPKMMCEAAPMGDGIFRDTCEEAKQFFQKALDTNCFPCLDCKEELHKQACKKIMKQNTEIEPKSIKGNESKSELFDACRLAKELKMIDKQWETTSKVWVELLCFAAAQSPADVHAMQLKGGGELVTVVMQLMLHFGLGSQFRTKKRTDVRKELIIRS